MTDARIESKQQHMANLVKSPHHAPAIDTKRKAPGSWLVFALVTALLIGTRAKAADTLNWRTNQNGVSADIQSARLVPVLEHVAGATGWRIFLEPGVTRTV